MFSMRVKIIIISFFLLLSLVWAEEQSAIKLVPGGRFAVSEGIYGTWEFNQKPQIGMVILKIQLFDKNDVKISPLTISGSNGMPSMPGHHDSGELAFKLNKKQNYLLPINVVMPGEWEVQLIFRDGEKIVQRAVIRFDV
ncbi:MAG: hypothetical protein WCL37_08370 [Chrysiogenales bacterium]